MSRNKPPAIEFFDALKELMIDFGIASIVFNANDGISYVEVEDSEIYVHGLSIRGKINHEEIRRYVDENNGEWEETE